MVRPVAGGGGDEPDLNHPRFLAVREPLHRGLPQCHYAIHIYTLLGIAAGFDLPQSPAATGLDIRGRARVPAFDLCVGG